MPDYLPVVLDVSPGPHFCSLLHILLQHRSDDIPPPSSQILTNRMLWFVLEVLLGQSMSVKGVQHIQEALVLRRSKQNTVAKYYFDAEYIHGVITYD